VRVLDLDLDFFQSGIVTWPQGEGRPSSSDHPPWPANRVAVFLESACGLDSSHLLPGHLAATHDKVFHRWKWQLASGQLVPPFDVVHVDAHADLSMGNAGWDHVCFELLHEDSDQRPEAAQAFVDEGNYLLFAIACRWVREVTYVYHPEVPILDGLPNDLMKLLFRDFDRKSGIIELPSFAPEDRPRGVTEGGVSPIRREPPVPFCVVSHDELKAPGPFDFAYLSVSPKYSSPAADSLIEVIGQYVRFDSPV